MDDLIKHRRRVLVATYLRFLAADRAWVEATDDARTWVHGTPRSVATLGAPRSRIRRLYAQRDRALTRLQVARLKLEVARRRLAATTARSMRPLLLPAP